MNVRLGHPLEVIPRRPQDVRLGRPRDVRLERRLGRQIGTSPGQSNKIFRGCPNDVRGGRPRDVLGTNICGLGDGRLRTTVKFYISL